MWYNLIPGSAAVDSMSTKHLRILPCFAITGFSFCTVFTAQDKHSQRVVIQGSVGRLLDDYATRASQLGFSGVLLVEKSGQIILHKGYGFADIERETPNSTSTIFYLASLSKQYTAAAILKLESSGKLKVGDPIRQYLVDVPADKSEITIHQLLTHSSGLDDFGFDPLESDWSVMDRDDAVRGILRTALRSSPGAKFAYSNTNYILLAAIVERASGKPIQEFVRSNLLGSSGARSTQFGWSLKGGSPEVAHSYAGAEDLGNYLDRPRSWLRVGPGDVLASVIDLDRWFRALKDGSILPRAEREKMFSMQREIEPGFGYGYGWWIRSSPDRTRRVVFHAGDYAGFHSELRWYSADEMTMIVATNREIGGRSITEAFLNDLGALIAGKTAPLTQTVAFAPGGSPRFAGKYFLPNGAWLVVSDFHGSLLVEAPTPESLSVLRGESRNGTSSCEQDGDRTLNLVLQLKHEGPGAYRTVLTPSSMPDEKEFEVEWSSLFDRFGTLKSFQILGNLPLRKDGSCESLLRMNYVRKTLTMGFVWDRGRLASTEPGATPPEAVIFAPEAYNKFTSYDWNTGKRLSMEFKSDESGTVQTLTLIEPSGSVLLRRQNDRAAGPH